MTPTMESKLAYASILKISGSYPHLSLYRITSSAVLGDGWHVQGRCPNLRDRFGARRGGALGRGHFPRDYGGPPPNRRGRQPSRAGSRTTPLDLCALVPEVRGPLPRRDRVVG